MTSQCRHCNKHIEISESLQRHQNGSIHIRGICPSCNSFLLWVPYNRSVIVHELITKEFEKESRYAKQS